MVYFEKSQPAPDCLAVEKAKNNGTYNCEDVVNRLASDFKNKCYICEYKEPSSINIEHFVSHQGNHDLKFSWNNLFLACAHCNNIKRTEFDNILNCTVLDDMVDQKIKYELNPFPFELPRITALEEDQRVINTQNLLISVYNGTTPQKRLESSYIRNKLLEEIVSFQTLLHDYFFGNLIEENLQLTQAKIRGHLNNQSHFTAFKRWIIWDNDRLNQEFGDLIE